MRSRAKRKWFHDEWRPTFAWLPHRVAFANGLAPQEPRHGDRNDMRMWVWLEPLEKLPTGRTRFWCQVYERRLPPMEKGGG